MKTGVILIDLPLYVACSFPLAAFSILSCSVCLVFSLLCGEGTFFSGSIYLVFHMLLYLYRQLPFKKRSIYGVYSALPACMTAEQKRAPDLIMDGCESPCGCWKLNSGTLEHQTVLLTIFCSPRTPSLD